MEHSWLGSAAAAATTTIITIIDKKDIYLPRYRLTEVQDIGEKERERA